MFLTVRFFSLRLVLAAALVSAGCSLERAGNADDPQIDDDAPTSTDSDSVSTGRVESDGSVSAPTSRPDAGTTLPSPGLQTDAGSTTDTPKTPVVDNTPDASTQDAAVAQTPSMPVPPPAQPEPQPPAPPAQPSQPTPTQPTPEPPITPTQPTQPTPEPPVQPPVFGFTLRSVDFVPDGALPQQFTCDGPSPQFSWQNAPSGVRSYALTLEQFDYRSSSSRLLWAMTNIPAGLSSLPRGYSTERGRFQAPVCGGSQRYTYTLYALSQGTSVGTGVQSVTRTVRGGETVFQPGGVLGTASLVGYFNP